MADLHSDVVGRVNRLALRANERNSLLPLMEAVSNSVHSITDLYQGDASTKGRITIRIERTDVERGKHRIAGFEVEDNGIGFTDENYRSFRTPDSRYKERRGGKGVGRLAWLKVFNNIEIDSTYHNGDGWARRQFIFRLSDRDQIVERESAEIVPGHRTIVRFRDVTPAFASRFPIREGIVQNRVAAHFVPLFLAGNAPKVLIEDTTLVDLELLFADSIVAQSTEDMMVGEGEDSYTLKIWSLRCHKNMRFGGPGFNFGFIAGDSRSVIDYTMDEQIGLGMLDEDTVYVGCVSSPYLDHRVNSERTAFTLDTGEIDDVKRAMAESARRFLAPYVQRAIAEKVASTRQVIAENPQFLYMTASLEDFASKLQANVFNKEEIFVALSRDRYRQHKRFANIAGAIRAGRINQQIEERVKEYSVFVADDKRGALAEYVARRKAVLDLFENLLEYKNQEDQTYHREDAMHQLFCPMRVTSGELEIEDHNLWLLDDRLAFFDFFASDKRINTFTTLGSDERPDIAFFYNACVAWREREGTDTVVIVEFKKPMRSDYSREKDPVQQVLSYVKRLKTERDVVDFRGRQIRGIRESTSFHCYIVADITPELEERIIGRFHQTPDGEGYFGYTTNPDAYVEIVPFNKVLNDARQRNVIFFRSLG